MSWATQFWVRSAGFPFTWMDECAVEASLPLLDARLADETELRETERRLEETLAAHMGRLPDRLARRMERREPIGANDLPSALAGPCEALNGRRDALLARLDASLPDLEASFAADAGRIRRTLSRHLSDPLVQEALFLSNPDALARLRALGERELDRLNGRSRQHLRLGWNYLQRLCTKNDTASFFGPIAWGRFAGPDAAALDVERAPGPWIAERRVFLEYWVVQRIAEAASADPALADDLPYRLNPACDLVDGTLRIPVGRSVRVPPLAADLLRALSSAPAGTLSPSEMAEVGRTLAADGKADGEAIAATLGFLVGKGVVERKIAVAAGLAEPELHLARQLSPLPAAAPWVALIDELRRLRDAFRHADLDGRVDIARSVGELLHERGIDTGRTSGSMYVGRYPFYEDCGRNLSVRIGGDLQAEIERGLEPVTRIYAWLARATAAAVEEQYRRTFASLPRDGDGTADFLAFLDARRSCARPDDAAADIRRALREAWDHVLGEHDGDEAVLAEDGPARVLQRLTASGLGSDGPHTLGIAIHSPDVMIAARSAEAVARGDYDIVIGEVHPGVHTASQPVALPFCPDMAEIAEEVDRALRPGRMVLADSPQTYQRSHIDWLDTPHLIQIVLPGSPGRTAPERQVPAGRGRVTERDGRLLFLDRATGATEDLVTVAPGDFHRALFELAADALAAHRHCRIRFGRIVLKRRSWTIPGGSFPDADLPGESAPAFAAWRGWARRTGLPRHVFAKSPEETKPVFVDFDNPLAVDLLAKLARQGAWMRLSEMSPGPQGLWLCDDRGRYTCEMRISFNDRQAPES